MASYYQIDRLNAHNYSNWVSDIKYLLIEKDCWDLVTGDETRPVVSETDGITARDVKDFDKREKTAQALIYLNAEPEFRKVIENSGSARSAWLKLKEHFEPDNRSRHMQLFTELCNCKINRNEGVDLFAARLRRIDVQLKGIKQPIPEIYLSFQLLRYLPSEFDSIVQGILRWEDTNFVFDRILTELIAEESRIKLREVDKLGESSYEAMLTKLVCWNCGQADHVKTDCTLPNLSKSSTSAPYAKEII